MAFSFDQYEKLARMLSDNKDEESVRTVVSRGYYCLFHRARSLSGDNKIGYGSHDNIIRGIANNLSIKNRLNISRMLDNFKQDRVSADYHSIPPHPLIFNQEYLRDRFWIRFEELVKLIEQNKDQ